LPRRLAVLYYFVRTPRNDDRVLGACSLLLAGIPWQPDRLERVSVTSSTSSPCMRAAITGQLLTSRREHHTGAISAGVRYGDRTAEEC
jgi:hypothetical protein